jgi:nucleoid-associated protein YgaU
MINPNIYAKRNLVKVLNDGKAQHYSVRDRATVVESVDYIVKQGETLYSIAKRLFGLNRQYMWTIIADINPPKMPDEWEVGDVIKLPRIIVQETAFPNLR